MLEKGFFVMEDQFPRPDPSTRDLFFLGHVLRVCKTGLRRHKGRNYMLDNDFSPAYSLGHETG